jgi:26S proteasome regulatory complex component, contains PCI domain
MIRNFKDAAYLFLDSIPTFNSPEVVTFNDLVFYTVLTSMVSLDRAEIRKKVSVIFSTLNHLRSSTLPTSCLSSRNYLNLKCSWILSIDVITELS